jgi:hypothetical protein
MSIGIYKIVFMAFLYPLYYAKANTYLITVLSDTSNCKREPPGAWPEDAELGVTEGAGVVVSEEAGVEVTEEAAVEQHKVSFTSRQAMYLA